MKYKHVWKEFRVEWRPDTEEEKDLIIEIPDKAKILKTSYFYWYDYGGFLKPIIKKGYKSLDIEYLEEIE